MPKKLPKLTLKPHIVLSASFYCKSCQCLVLLMMLYRYPWMNRMNDFDFYWQLEMCSDSPVVILFNAKLLAFFQRASSTTVFFFSSNQFHSLVSVCLILDIIVHAKSYLSNYPLYLHSFQIPILVTYSSACLVF